MDIFDDEVLKFWAAFQHFAVKYIMVGMQLIYTDFNVLLPI
jgi:hypothetical protein